MDCCRLEWNVMTVIFWFLLSNRGTLCALKFYLILLNLGLNIYTWLSVGAYKAESCFLWGLTFVNFGIGFLGMVCRVSRDPLQLPQPPSALCSASPLTAKVTTVFYQAAKSLHLLHPLSGCSGVGFGYLYLLVCSWYCYPFCRDPF